jgi:hypothetical protein
VVIGGAMVLALLPRLLQPALLVLAHRKQALLELSPRKAP